MSKKKTHEEYVIEVNKTNPNIEVVEQYINTTTSILHRFKIDGYEWLVRPNDILSGKGCPICGQIKKSKARTKSNKRYVEELSKINPNIEAIEPYIQARIKIMHRCKKCGYEWLVAPDSILHGKGCPRCAKNIKKTHTEYVEELCLVNPNIEVVGTYINSCTKILHKCKIDGYEWFVTPNDIVISGHGCPKCSGVLKPTQQEYIDKVRTINKEIEVVGGYITRDTKILHKCKKCGNEWSITPSHILGGRECPKCNGSYGERKIDKYLTEHNIEFIFQHKFPNCKNQQPLPFDFYLPTYNACIEYDGIQHFEPVEIFGGTEAFEYTKNNDAIKNQYCKDNKITLLRIKYDKDIFLVLDNFFKNIKDRTEGEY